MKERTDASMTTAPIAKSLVMFAGPLLLSSLLQQFYNTADSLVVGKFLNDSALAAVSSSSSLIYLMVDFFNGLFTGAGILIANLFGQGDRDKMSPAVHTTMALGVVTGVLLMGLGNLLAPVLLRLMDTPNGVMAEALSYFRVYFGGSLAFVMYNCCTGILRNIGDSFHPLIYLITASAVNIILDLIFVGVFHWGVASVAFATILAQGLSALLCFRRLCRETASYQVVPSQIKIHPGPCRIMLGYGVPAGLQNAMIALSNVVVQASINRFDVKAIAGCGIWSKLEGFALLPILSFTMALSTFVGQNIGAGNHDRVRKGSFYGILSCGVLAVVTGIVLFCSAPFLSAIFKDDPEIIAFSVMRAHIVTPFFCFLGISNCIGGILRGAGKAKQSMVIYMLTWCVVRIAFISIGVRVLPDIRIVFAAYPLTWGLSTVAFLLEYRKLLRQYSNAL